MNWYETSNKMEKLAYRDDYTIAATDMVNMMINDLTGKLNLKLKHDFRKLTNEEKKLINDNKTTQDFKTNKIFHDQYYFRINLLDGAYKNFFLELAYLNIASVYFFVRKGKPDSVIAQTEWTINKPVKIIVQANINFSTEDEILPKINLISQKMVGRLRHEIDHAENLFLKDNRNETYNKFNNQGNMVNYLLRPLEIDAHIRGAVVDAKRNGTTIVYEINTMIIRKLFGKDNEFDLTPEQKDIFKNCQIKYIKRLSQLYPQFLNTNRREA